MKRKSSVLIMLILLLPLSNVFAQYEGIQSTSSLTFEKSYTMAEGGVGLSSDQVTIDIQPNVELSFSNDMIISSKTSAQYAKKGESTSLTLDVTNAVSSFELNGDVDIEVSWNIFGLRGSDTLPVMDVKFQYSIPEQIGTSQDIVLGDYLLFSGTIPIAGLYVSISMKPIVQYTPTLSGTLNAQGSATVNPYNLVWNDDSITSQISFMETEPVNVFLSDPGLTLSNFKMFLEFSAVIAFIPTPPASFDVVSLGNEVMTSSAVHLLSFEPDLFSLYIDIGNSLDSLSSYLTQLESSMVQVEEEMRPFNSQLGILGSEISLLSEKYESLEDFIHQLELGTSSGSDNSLVQGILDELSYLNSSTQDLISQYNAVQQDIATFEELVYQVNQSIMSLKSDYVLDEDYSRKGESPLLYIALLISLLGCALGGYSIIKQST